MNTATVSLGLGRVSSRAAETLKAVASGLISHAWLYAVAAIAQICALAESLYLGRPFEIRLVLFSLPIVMIAVVLAALCLMLREVIRLGRAGHKGSAIVPLSRLVVDDFLAPERVANIVHSTIATSFFISAFLTLKNFLPAMHPFQWDETFMQWDRAVHFGFHPYELLQPVLGHPQVTGAINYAYNGWFFFMLSAWIATGYARRDSLLRRQFLLAFMLCWFIGTDVLGTIFSSVGPCFYGRLLGGEDPFQPLMAYLNQANGVMEIYALGTQDMLWKGYLGDEGMIKGISAMPSMHVATCVLMTLLSFAGGKRWFGWFFVAFTGIIFLGSIHLAWHYAIDGYAGAAVALGAWFLAGRLVRWRTAKEGVRAPLGEAPLRASMTLHRPD